MGRRHRAASIESSGGGVTRQAGPTGDALRYRAGEANRRKQAACRISRSNFATDCQPDQNELPAAIRFWLSIIVAPRLPRTGPVVRRPGVDSDGCKLVQFPPLRKMPRRMFG
ncbi:hypothetical protein Pan189_41210 [Stratiformator vulcanicus]|uniref:Uncharacterized protein n=1 Tax=Stratiformator vulcanicus TaxID=2527980 RepID=A0A517R783_9PLAN|nr:hypothetical protein Pan189_41210 [Stratiformator vulcanicus]